MRFREDILRGIRLFAIVFAAILVCVAAYRMLRAPADLQDPPQESAAASGAAQPPPGPSTDAPVSEAAPDVHPLIVPEPPPVPGAPVEKPVTHPRDLHARDPHPRDQGVPPPPPTSIAPVIRAHRASAPSGSEFAPSGPVVSPAAPVEDSPEAKPAPPGGPVGYKSLIEANPNRAPAEPVAAPASDDAGEKTAKGKRFFKAIGKIFHVGGKKDTDPQ